MDMKKVEHTAFTVVRDVGGTWTVALAFIGDRLGLFKAMVGTGPISSEELATKTHLNERYVREWAKAMVAAEYVDYQPETGKFVLTEEQAFVLANEDSPMFCGGAIHLAIPTVYNVPKIMEHFKQGGGISYFDIGPELPEAIERFFRPGYVNFLVQDWLTKLPGNMIARLEKGVEVLDVGCGCGQSTVTMAKAFPKSKFFGIDYDPRSIARARKLAEGLSNVEFHQGPAHEIPEGRKFDLVCSFDCIHDMVDPIATLKAIRGALKSDGVYLWSEPNASHNPLDNRNPVGKAYCNISPLHCMTVSLAYNGAGLGTVIGEKGARELADKIGFSQFQKLPIDNAFNQFFALQA